jgi:hypothetical protein
MARQQERHAPSLWDYIVGRPAPKTASPPQQGGRERLRDVIRDRGRTVTITTRGGSQAQRDRRAMEHQQRTDPAFIRGQRKAAAKSKPAAKTGGGYSWRGPAFSGGSKASKPKSAQSGGYSWLGPAFKR